MSSHDELCVKLGLSLLDRVQGNLINLDSTEAVEKTSSGNWDPWGLCLATRCHVGDRSPARVQGSQL